MLLKSYGLKRTNKKDRNFACQEEGCAEVKKTQGELNRHLQYDHKINFKCYVCDRLYDTANSRDKHFKKALQVQQPLVLSVDTHANCLDK